MTHGELEAYLLGKVGAVKEFPFGPEAAVFKVAGRMFALLAPAAGADRQAPARINLKCRPEDGAVLRSLFAAVSPGYHMNKRHWNTVTLDGSLPDDILFGLVDTSYDLVLEKLPQRLRRTLAPVDARERCP